MKTPRPTILPFVLFTLLLCGGDELHAQGTAFTYQGRLTDTAPTNRLMVVNARCDGSSWINSSDRNLKENFVPVNTKAVLEKVTALPLTRWNYKDDPGTPHLGPVAQDFKAGFGLGADDTSIATVDADGVALAAIQGLNAKVEERDASLRAELKRRDDENAKLKVRLSALEKIIANLGSKVN